MCESIATGEEFRDDTRIRRVLPPQVLRELTRLDPVQSTFSVLTTLAVMAAHRELEARGILDGAEVRPWLETVGLVAADRRPA